MKDSHLKIKYFNKSLEDKWMRVHRCARRQRNPWARTFCECHRGAPGYCAHPDLMLAHTARMVGARGKG